jgi:hypothetical protein
LANKNIALGGFVKPDNDMEPKNKCIQYKLEYFGTALDCPGHYRWKVNGDKLTDQSLDLKSLPFNPEEMPRKGRNETHPKGYVEFYHESGYSIIAIEGSCVDRRWGAHSIFFVKSDKMNAEQLFILIQATEITRKIIEKMPFEIQWSEILPVYAEPSVPVAEQPLCEDKKNKSPGRAL